MKRIIKFSAIIFSLILLFWAVNTFAQGYKLEVDLPSLPSAEGPGTTIASYINYIYVFAIALGGFLAFGVLVLGGLQYVLAAGNVAKVESAKEMMNSALLGLGILLVSYLLLRTINPDLVNLRNPSLTPITGGISSQTQTTGPGVIAPGQISVGQTCQKDADCTAGGSLGGQITCSGGQCIEFTTGGF